VVAWGIPISVRVGYGFGVYGDGAIPFGSLAGLYFQLGSSF
jgi:hypothetical protein